ITERLWEQHAGANSGHPAVPGSAPKLRPEAGLLHKSTSPDTPPVGATPRGEGCEWNRYLGMAAIASRQVDADQPSARERVLAAQGSLPAYRSGLSQAPQVNTTAVTPGLFLCAEIKSKASSQ